MFLIIKLNISSTSNRFHVCWIFIFVNLYVIPKDIDIYIFHGSNGEMPFIKNLNTYIYIFLGLAPDIDCICSLGPLDEALPTSTLRLSFFEPTKKKIMCTLVNHDFPIYTEVFRCIYFMDLLT